MCVIAKKTMQTFADGLYSGNEKRSRHGGSKRKITYLFTGKSALFIIAGLQFPA